MRKTRLQTRADDDTADAVEEYCDESDLSQSEGVRRLLRRGLAEEGYDVAVADGGLTNAVEDLHSEIEELKRLEQQKSQNTKELRRIQTFIGAAAIAYVAITAALPSLDAGVTMIWAVIGIVIATLLLLTTHRLWGEQ